MLWRSWPHMLMCVLLRTGRRKHSTRDRACHRRSVFDDGTGAGSSREAPATTRRPVPMPPRHPTAVGAPVDSVCAVCSSTNTSTRRGKVKLSPSAAAELRAATNQKVGQRLKQLQQVEAFTQCLVARGGSQQPKGQVENLVGEQQPSSATTPERVTRAATVIQSAVRGRLVRKLKLAGFAAHEQRAAVDRLRARRHFADPSSGREILPPRRRVVLGNQVRKAPAQVRTVYC